jgi:hypothetical protein
MKDEGAATDIAGPPRERAGLPTKGAEWLAPEPWGRTLWGVTKSTVVFGAVFWTGMSLMGEPVSLLQTGITALFVSAAQILTRRTGGSMPAAPSLYWRRHARGVGRRRCGRVREAIATC